MELHLALKNIVNLSGTSILKEQRLVNILADFNAYDDIPSAKFIIKTIIDEGYMEKFLANGKWDVNCNKLIDQFAAMTGIVKDNVSFVFESIGYSVGWNVTPLINTCYNYNIASTSVPISVEEQLQRKVRVVNSNKGICKLELQNPTATMSGKSKILVACEVQGENQYSFIVFCSIYAKDVIVQTTKLGYVYNFQYTGFTIVSADFKLKCDVQDISKIVIYIGS